MAFILMTDLVMKLNWENLVKITVGILIKKVHDVNFEEVPIYNRRIAQQRDTTTISRRFGYITTELDLSQDTLKEAIQYKQYVTDECWINTLYDFYGDNLLSENKKRHFISISMILEIIGKTEENIKEGISINDILHFLKNSDYTFEFMINFLKWL